VSTRRDKILRLRNSERALKEQVTRLMELLDQKTSNRNVVERYEGMLTRERLAYEDALRNLMKERNELRRRLRQALGTMEDAREMSA
jgi:hypothetical protein